MNSQASYPLARAINWNQLEDDKDLRNMEQINR